MRRTVLVFLLLTTPAFAKSLHWSAIDVDAHLDAAGALHVLERQTMVFDGDWNGGERDFNARPGQTLTLNRIARIENGQEIELTEGIDHVDGFAWQKADVLRWRSRLATDPSFDNRSITYLLDYTWSDIVRRDGDAYRIDHDFGLPSRAGDIDRFTLHLDFDPAWNQAPITFAQDHVRPGMSLIVHRELQWSGANPPAHLKSIMPKWMPLAALGLFIAGALFLVARLLVEERARGRFAPVVAQLDEALLRMPAEVVGAAWDDDIGAAEVSAVLARMTHEDKLATTVDGKTLHLRLKVPRRELQGYERDLVDAMFFDSSDRTNTDMIRKHYKSTGFDPSTKIAPGITAQLAGIPQLAGTESRTNGWLNALLIVLAGLLLGAIIWLRPPERGVVITSMFIAVFTTLFAAAIAWQAAKRVTGFVYPIVGPAIPFAIGMIPFLVSVWRGRAWDYDAIVLLGLALWQLAILNLVVECSKIRDLPARIAFRKRLAAARAYFIGQLKLERPALRDEWFPYVLAFGLGKNADRWFRAYGTASSSATSSSSWSSGSSSSASTGWTGGGGAFGGAGATGSWAVAASTMAAGVSAPSTSSGGGGSSSGGGGGGGW